MPLHLGRIFFCRLENAQITQNEGIHTGILTQLKERGHLPDLIGSGKHIDGNIHLCAIAVGKFHCLHQFFIGKVTGFCTHTVILTCQIYRICSKAHRHLQLLRISGRRKQFRFTEHWWVPPYLHQVLRPHFPPLRALRPPMLLPLPAGNHPQIPQKLHH